MIEIFDGNYERVIYQEDYVLLDVWSPMCAPCIKMAPILEELQGKITVIKMNVLESGENMSAAISLGVKSIPAFFIFKNGKMVYSWVGEKSKDKIEQLIERYS